MRTYLFIFVALFYAVANSQTNQPTPVPTPKLFYGQEVDNSPLSSEEQSIVNKIKAQKKEIMLRRQEQIREGKIKPNKWDVKFVEDMKAKGEKIQMPSGFKKSTPVPVQDVDAEFKALVEKRQKRNEELAKEAAQRAKAESTPVPEPSATPEVKELSEEEKKYLKEKEEFLKKFKKQN